MVETVFFKNFKNNFFIFKLFWFVDVKNYFFKIEKYFNILKKYTSNGIIYWHLSKHKLRKHVVFKAPFVSLACETANINLLLLIARACPQIIIEKQEKSRKGHERQWTLLGPHLKTGLPLPLPEKSLASPSRKSHIITFIIVIISTYIHHLNPTPMTHHDM
jgi:hypothetical protein